MAARQAESTAADVRRGVTRLSQRLRSERPQGSLSGNKLAVLGLLRRLGESQPGRVTRALHQQPQSLTRVFADLERDGLVARRPDPDDRRQSLLQLTSRGADLLRDDMHDRDRWLVLALDQLSEVELGVLDLAAGILERLAEVEVGEP